MFLQTVLNLLLDISAYASECFYLGCSYWSQLPEHMKWINMWGQWKNGENTLVTRFVYLASFKQNKLTGTQRQVFSISIVQGDLKVSIQWENGLYLQNVLSTGTITLITHTDAHVDTIPYLWRLLKQPVYAMPWNFECYAYLSRTLRSVLDSAWWRSLWLVSSNRWCWSKTTTCVMHEVVGRHGSERL
jgi:hypothetical protein